MRCLAIVLNNQRRAQQVFEMARKNNTRENFGELAAQYSVEPGSQALRGEVPPIKTARRPAASSKKRPSS